MIFDFLDPELTNEEVAAGARPGESWAEARRRLERLNIPQETGRCIECGDRRWISFCGELSSALCARCDDAIVSELEELQRELAREEALLPQEHALPVVFSDDGNRCSLFAQLDSTQYFGAVAAMAPLLIADAADHQVVDLLADARTDFSSTL